MGASIPTSPFAQGSRRLWKPSAAPNIQWADGFSVADSILGWSCSVVAAREDVPKEVLLFLIPALPLQGMEQDPPGKMQPKDVLFPARAFALSIVPMSKSIFRRNLAWFYCNLIYCLSGSCPSAAASQSPAYGTGESITSVFHPVKHLHLHVGAFWGFLSISS